MSWRFYPLEGVPDTGVLASGANSKPHAAMFLTPEQAKAIQERKERVARR